MPETEHTSEGRSPALRAWTMPAILAMGVGSAFFGSWWSGRAFVRYPDAEVANVENVHDYKGKPLCQACHPGKSRRLSADPIAVCQKCHGAEHNSHPVGVPMKSEDPIDLPLGEGRTIVCHTCHDQHDLRAFKYGLRMELTPLCRKCHEGH